MHADRAFGAAQDSSDVRRGHLLKVPEGERRPLVHTNFFQRRLNLLLNMRFVRWVTYHLLVRRQGFGIRSIDV